MDAGGDDELAGLPESGRPAGDRALLPGLLRTRVRNRTLVGSGQRADGLKRTGCSLDLASDTTGYSPLAVTPLISPELALVDPELRASAIAALPERQPDGFLPAAYAAPVSSDLVAAGEPETPAAAARSHLLEAAANGHLLVVVDVDVEPLVAGSPSGAQPVPLAGFPDVLVIELPVKDVIDPPFHLVNAPEADDLPASPPVFAAPRPAAQTAALVPVSTALVPIAAPSAAPRYPVARLVGSVVGYAAVQAVEFAVLGAVVVAFVIAAAALATIF